jgi:hypothetical protein
MSRRKCPFNAKMGLILGALVYSIPPFVATTWPLIKIAGMFVKKRGKFTGNLTI